MEEFGIKENQEYFIILDKTKICAGGRSSLRGNILNFTPRKTVLKTEFGLFILKTCEIEEMYPIK